MRGKFNSLVIAVGLFVFGIVTEIFQNVISSVITLSIFSLFIGLIITHYKMK